MTYVNDFWRTNEDIYTRMPLKELVKRLETRFEYKKSMFLFSSELGAVLRAIDTNDYTGVVHLENWKNLTRVGYFDYGEMEILVEFYKRYLNGGSNEVIKITHFGFVSMMKREDIIFPLTSEIE